MEQNRAFCLMPWIHLHVTQYGTVTPCCVAPWDEKHAFGNINTSSIGEIWNGSDIKAFRRNMLNGIKDSRCQRCYQMEKAGKWSLRQSVASLYREKIAQVPAQTEKDGTVPEWRPVYLDIRFSNKCNLRCRICNADSSSSWYEDALKLGTVDASQPKLTQSIDDVDRLLGQLADIADGLEEIYFAGGEPLFLEEHYRLLDMLLDKGKTDMVLRYSTNFSALSYKGYDVLEYWRRFEKVVINASLDDAGGRAELQRKGLNWKRVVANMKKVKAEAPHVYIAISPTLNIFNIWSIASFHKQLVEEGLIETDEFIPNVLEQPEYYSIKVLPLELKRQLEKQLLDHALWIDSRKDGEPHLKDWVASEFRNTVQYMMSEDRSDLQQQLSQQIRALDDIRGEQTLEVIPELQFAFQ